MYADYQLTINLMKAVYGYIRVSTAKQGEGVSLDVQKEAITRYAYQNRLTIEKWYEEKETAAKEGRPVFNQMLSLLKARKASGVIMHKIDRSARNLKDWADLGSLIDQGVEIHFAHESLDLNARGGRLSADIQAVIAADYIRNLRQEALKGLYGRIKQGMYPFKAPIGYLDQGGGKVKVIDPKTAPFIKMAFDLYSTNRYSLIDLSHLLFEQGFVYTNGKPWGKNRLSQLLNNPFYIGLMRIKNTLYEGRHDPLITPKMYETVQAILSGKAKKSSIKHEFDFRKMITCKECQYSLTGEIQKGNVYYRCHTSSCPTKGIRGKAIDKLMIYYLMAINLTEKEMSYLKHVEEYGSFKDEEQQTAGLTVRISAIRDRLSRLTDCLIDGAIDKETHDIKKENLLKELKNKESLLEDILRGNNQSVAKAEKFFELAKTVVKSYQNADPVEKRSLLKILTSNLRVSGKNIEITFQKPFQRLIEQRMVLNGGPTRYRSRKVQVDFAEPLPWKIKPLSKAEIIKFGRYVWRYYRAECKKEQ